MSRFGKKTVQKIADVELNVMPFIDIFSLLCTFLLFSAVFISIGIHTVQIPFLSNASASEDNSKDDKPKREISLELDANTTQISLKTKWSLPPVNEKVQTFTNDKTGLIKLHEQLLILKNENQESDKLTLFTDDDIDYNNLILILDSVRLKTAKEGPSNSLELYPKVVLGSVIL